MQMYEKLDYDRSLLRRYILSMKTVRDVSSVLTLLHFKLDEFILFTVIEKFVT